MRKKLIIGIYLIVIVLLVVSVKLGMTVSALNSKPSGIIADGISVNGINLGLKPVKEAKRLLKEYIDTIGSKRVTISFYGTNSENAKEEVGLSEIGIKAKYEALLEELSQIGERGNIIERYKELKDVEINRPNYSLDFTYSKKNLNKVLDNLVKKYRIEPENATITRKDGNFIVSDGVVGRSIDKKELKEKTVATINNFIDGLKDGKGTDLLVEMNFKPEKPRYGRAELEEVRDLLGSYTTRYTPVGGRGLNIETGAKYINGSLLMPGEELSANKKMEPYTVENGYGIGGAFVNGKLVDDIGGGICQVSTTLYNAVLYSELEVKQRQNHSMMVGYVPLARDAAIAGTWKDLVFKNNTEYPIYIEAITVGGKITFNIYGHETRDIVNRKVDFKTVILPAKTGHRSQLYKLVYLNGREVERSLVNTSYYKPSEKEIEEAKKKEEEKKKLEEEKKKKDKEEAKKDLEEDDLSDDEEGIEG